MKASKVNLRDYLWMVLDVETNIYAQNRLMNSLAKQREAITSLNYLQEPTPPSEPKASPQKPGWLMVCASIILAFLIVKAYNFEYPDWMDSISFIIVIIWLLCIVLAFCLLIGGIGAIIANHTNAKVYQDAQREYPRKYDTYQKEHSIWLTTTAQIKAENERRENARAILTANYNAVQDKNARSKLYLRTLYDANIIYKKYRNFSEVSSLYEYIESGRCTELEGPNGAYNILELEIRLDRIVVQLDQVIARLDSIRDSQFQLYNAIQEANQRSEVLLQSVTQDVKQMSFSAQASAKHLSELEANSKVIAYNTERTQKELEYYNRMRYELGDYLHVRNNQLP